MRRQFFFALFASLFALLSAANTSAQKPAQEQTPLPDAFGSWHSTNCDANAQRPGVSKEAGERDFRQCQFTSGKQSATIWAGKYRDPSSAYEVYTSLLRPTMSPPTVGRFTAVSDKTLFILSANFFILSHPTPTISPN